MRFELRAKPGEMLRGTIKVWNDGAERIEVTVEPEEWSKGPAGGRGLTPWLAVEPTALTLGADRTKKVRFEARVPAEATGELAAQIFFTVETTSSEGEPLLRTRQGVILYVAIKGTETVKAEISRVRFAYQPSRPEVPKPDTWEAWVEVVNQGNVHLRPHGDAVIADASGKPLYRIPLQSGWGLLPNERYEFLAQGHQIYLAPGAYQLRTEVQVGELFDQPTDLTHQLSFQIGESGQLVIHEETP